MIVKVPVQVLAVMEEPCMTLLFTTAVTRVRSDDLLMAAAFAIALAALPVLERVSSKALGAAMVCPLIRTSSASMGSAWVNARATEKENVFDVKVADEAKVIVPEPVLRAVPEIDNVLLSEDIDNVPVRFILLPSSKVKVAVATFELSTVTLTMPDFEGVPVRVAVPLDAVTEEAV